MSGIDIELLRGFAALARLSEEQLILLASRISVRTADAGSILLERGSRDGMAYFLLKGILTLQDADGRVTRLEGGTDSARHAISPLQPRQFEVRAVSHATLAVVEQALLTRLLKEAPVAAPTPAPSADASAESPAYALLMRFYQDLKTNQVHLPSLPDVALRIRHVADQERSNASDISRVIRNDPAMTAKLIKAANSPFYRGWSAIETCEDAVIRLGIKTTRQLITIFALRELFRTRTPHLKDRMERLWDYSREVAAIAYVLAKMTPGLNAEHAMLAGLLHAIGTIPVIIYAEKHLSLVKYPEMLEEVIEELHSEMGVALLEQWGFPGDLVAVVQSADDYGYESGSDQPDYVDIVLIAKIHAAIGKSDAQYLPAMETVPAFRKLALGELTPDRSLKVLAQAQQELTEARNIVGGTGS